MRFALFARPSLSLALSRSPYVCLLCRLQSAVGAAAATVTATEAMPSDRVAHWREKAEIVS